MTDQAIAYEWLLLEQMRSRWKFAPTLPERARMLLEYQGELHAFIERHHDALTRALHHEQQEVESHEPRTKPQPDARMRGDG